MNQHETYIGPHHAGVRLDRFLLSRFRYYNRLQWHEQIEKGHLLVNGSRRKHHYVLQVGDLLSFKDAEFIEPEINREFGIIFEDDDLLIVEKPNNIPVHATGKYLHNTLIDLVKQHQLDQGKSDQIFMAHRLDKDTSGVLLMAKNVEALNFVAKQFRKHQVRKRYCFLVPGKFNPERTMVELPIGPNPASPIRTRYAINTVEGKYALTFFERKLYNEQHDFSIVEAQPKTGRTNQIRLHAAILGFPMMGDWLYGTQEKALVDYLDYDQVTDQVLAQYLDHSLTLHAYSLEITHPRTRQRVTFTAPSFSSIQHSDPTISIDRRLLVDLFAKAPQFDYTLPPELESEEEFLSTELSDAE